MPFDLFKWTASYRNLFLIFAHTGGRWSRRCQPGCWRRTCYNSAQGAGRWATRLCHAAANQRWSWRQPLHRSSRGCKREYITELYRTDHIHTRYINKLGQLRKRECCSSPEFENIHSRHSSSGTITILTLIKRLWPSNLLLILHKYLKYEVPNIVNTSNLFHDYTYIYIYI